MLIRCAHSTPKANSPPTRLRRGSSGRCCASDDRLRLFELHGTDVKLLADNFHAAGRRVMVTQATASPG